MKRLKRLTGRWRRTECRFLLGIILWSSLFFDMSHVPCLVSQLDCSLAHAGQMSKWPSLFRGIVVADSPLGVRVVEVAPDSQAARAQLRPEDIIVRVNDAEIRSIDEFASVSQQWKGQAATATVVVFRNGTPLEVFLHLYSAPVLEAWGLRFIPDHDLRFGDPRAGRDYWARLGRGFEIIGKWELALEAHLNALHQMPSDVPTAAKSVELLLRIGQERLAGKNLAGGFSALRRATQLMARVFDHPLDDQQLQAMRDGLQATLEALRAAGDQRGSDPNRKKGSDPRLDSQTNV